MNLYPVAVAKIFAAPTEESIKLVITPAAIRELGIKPNGGDGRSIPTVSRAARRVR